MKEPTFDSTPEFRHFKEVMRGVLAVPKKRLDELVQLAKTSHAETDQKKPKENIAVRKSSNRQKT